MEIIRKKPKEELRGRIASDYYLANEAQFGKNIFRTISLKRCALGDTTSLLLQSLDPNYQKTNQQVNEAYEDIFNDFIGFYADNGHLVAHATITTNGEIDGKLVAKVSEILIYDKEALISQSEEYDSLNWVYGIYKEMIGAIETVVSSRYQMVERIDLTGDLYDGILWNVTEQLGYEVLDGVDLEGNKLIFSKYVNERAVTYERRNPAE